MRKPKLALLGTSLLALGLAGGCAGGDADQQANQADQPKQVRVQQSAPNADEERTRATEARLESIAEGINEVKHANCVIVGDTAIVGIDVGADVDRSRVGTIKYAVAEALKKDPVGIDAIVTADMDLNQRLQEIRQDMANGRPMQGIAEELSDIIGRIIPQMPRDTESVESTPPAPDATTQERGAQKAQAREDGAQPPSPSTAPKDNRSFPNHPANR